MAGLGVVVYWESGSEWRGGWMGVGRQAGVWRGSRCGVGGGGAVGVGGLGVGGR